ncbi:rod shape-determining protein MreD [Paenibacillaceae bacterium]|nr:rod shape-determining protein MreD [Paenibacillaceae bacterium]
MRLRYIVMIMLLLFIIEGTIMPWIIPSQMSGRMVPEFTLIFVLFAALYTGRHVALLLGIAFGLLQDIVFYGHMIGVHSFAMGLCGYLFGLLLGQKRIPMLTVLSLIGIGCLFYDTTIHAIYRIFRITHASYNWVLMNHIVPSLFLQLAFALAVYIPARRWFAGAIIRKAGEDKD